MKNKENTLLNNLSPDETAEISKRIVYLRNSILHMTQSQFANHVKISQTYLSMLENGKKGILDSTICQIATSLHVNLDWLVYGIGGDENIFQSETITKEYFEETSKKAILLDLQAAYSLKPNEVDFITWYLNLSSKDKQKYIAALGTISELYH